MRSSGESLAAAVADHASIDWRESRAPAQAPIPSSYIHFKIISAIGEARRASVVADHSRSARALLACRSPSATVTLAKLALAAVGVVVGWSLVTSGTRAVGVRASTCRCLASRAPARGRQHARSPRAGARPAVPRHRVGVHDAPADRCCAAAALLDAGRRFSSRSTAEAFLALALWQFVWLFPSEPKPHWARTIGKTFLIAASVVGITLFVVERDAGADDRLDTAPWAAALSAARSDWRRRCSTGRCCSRWPRRPFPI